MGILSGSRWKKSMWMEKQRRNLKFNERLIHTFHVFGTVNLIMMEIHTNLVETIEIYGKYHIESIEMSKYTRSIGSQIQLIFRAKFATFTPDQFRKALKDEHYIEVRQAMPNPQNPQAQPVIVHMFSKENVNVFLSPIPNTIIFQVLNVVNLKETYKEITKILVSLNIYPEIISRAILNCNTRSKAKTQPQKNLTSLVQKDFLEEISKDLGRKLEVSSIRLSTAFPLGTEGLQVLLEPLGTSPKDEYYLNIIYQTPDKKKFDAFVNKFGDNIIQEIIEEVEKSG